MQKQIKIINNTFKVLYDKSLLEKPDTSYGECQIDKKQIVIDPNAPDQDNILLHEILEAINWTCGLDLPHSTITTLDAVLSDVLSQINKPSKKC